MVCTVQERAALKEQIKLLRVSFRFEHRRRWIDVESFPDGVTWLVYITTWDGRSQEGCVNGDDRLEQELADIIGKAKAWLQSTQHGAN